MIWKFGLYICKDLQCAVQKMKQTKKNPIFTFEMKWEVKNMNYAFMWRRDILSIRLQSNSSFILKLLICAAFCLPLCLWQTLDCVGTIGFI